HPVIPAYWNAFYFVFEHLLETGRSEDWPALVNASSPAALDAVAARAWARAALECSLPSDAPTEELWATPPGGVISAYRRLGAAGGSQRSFGRGEQSRSCIGPARGSAGRDCGL